MRFLPILPIFIAILLCGCAGKDCYENQNSLPLAGFYSSEPTPKPISIDSITIFGLDAPDNAMIADSVKSLDKVYLPFRINADATTYIFKFNAFNIADTIKFYYQREPWFVNAECGAIYKFHITDIRTTTNLIDSVTCPTGTITNQNVENLHIYFKTQQES